MSKNTNPWIEKYLLDVARKHGAALSSVEEQTKTKMLQINKYLDYPNSMSDTCVWALCSDRDLRIPVCFTKAAMESFVEPRTHTANQEFGLRNQLRAIIRIRQFRPGFRRLPAPNGLTSEHELFLQVDFAELFVPPGDEVIDGEKLVSVHKKDDLRRWIHGLRNGNGNILKHETSPQKATSITVNTLHDLPMPPVPFPTHGRSAAPAGPSNDAPPSVAASGSTTGSTLAERNRLRDEKARASRKARRSNRTAVKPAATSPQANETPRAAPAPTHTRSQQLGSEPQHHQPQAPTSNHTAQPAPAKGAHADLPSTPRVSKPSSRRPRSALLPGDSSPVRLTTYPPISSPANDDEESEDDGKRRPTTPSPSDWPATQSPAHSSPQPMPSSDAWMRSSPDPPSPVPPPPKAPSRLSRHEPKRASSSSTSGASTSRARSPRSSTGSLTMQGKRHAAEPPPVPPPGTQEKVLVPNSDTSLSLSQGLSQEKGSQGRGGLSKGAVRGRGTKVRTRTERQQEEKAGGRQVDDAGERKRRRLDAQHTATTNAEGGEARMPGHFSPADADSETVEALIGSDSRRNATAAPSPQLYPNLDNVLGEDDQQILTAVRDATDKGKGKAREVETVVEEPAAEPAPPPHQLHHAEDEAPYVNLRALTGSNERKQPIRSSNFVDFLERPAKKARTADGKGKAPKRQVESKGTVFVEASTSRGASSTPAPLISWIPDDPPYPPSQREEDARALAIVREMSALVEKRRRKGYPAGEELTKEEERKYTLISGKIKPSKR